jgi:hypothetical protein
MTRLLPIQNLPAHTGLQVIAFEDGGRVWLGLCGICSEPKVGSRRVVRYWSSTAGDSGADSLDDVVAQISDRVTAPGGALTIDDRLLYWPRGWACWGSGIPLPIASHVDEFGRFAGGGLPA